MRNPSNGIRALFDDVVSFAEAAAKASKLPGGQFGPRDAFRHMVGSAELTRRVGLLPAWTLTEANEARSMLTSTRRSLMGETVRPVL